MKFREIAQCFVYTTVEDDSVRKFEEKDSQDYNMQFVGTDTRFKDRKIDWNRLWKRTMRRPRRQRCRKLQYAVQRVR